MLYRVETALDFPAKTLGLHKPPTCLASVPFGRKGDYDSPTLCRPPLPRATRLLMSRLPLRLEEPQAWIFTI